MQDKFKDKCGLFGVYGHPDAMNVTLSGLSALQHRGQDSAGIAYESVRGIECAKAMGSVRNLVDRLRAVKTTAAIGHVRYATCGDSSIVYAQPILAHGASEDLALCHNGHVVDIERLRQTAFPDTIQRDANDSQLLATRIAGHFTVDIGDAVERALKDVTPAYAVIVLTPNSICAARDRFGMRPLSIASKDAATVLSSESCAFDAVHATYIRDVSPGEVFQRGDAMTRSLANGASKAASAQCIFELIYFARPDSVMFGHSVAVFRTRLGERLAREAPVSDADVVVPVPDSALYGALGYSRVSGLEFSLALYRTPSAGRSFLEPTTAARAAAVLSKLHPIEGLVKGRSVVLVDDSIVRGNTSVQIAAMLRHAGARAVHLRIASPPTIASCHFGIDTPDDGELFARGRGTDEMSRVLGVDSLAFLSLDGLLATAGSTQGSCVGCFSGQYPIELPARLQWHRSVV